MKNKTIPQLRAKAKKVFNEYIRTRDTNDQGIGVCISSGRWIRIGGSNAHAGHFYPVGSYPWLQFNEDNCHLQSRSDNYYKSGNLLEYRRNLIRKIGEERVAELDRLALRGKRGFRWSRFELEDIIKEYTIKLNNLKKSKT